jgi:pimeloyl-ACP methyl ester carboxylesterase
MESQKVKLHFAHIGPDHGKMVLFLHGFPENWYTWKKQLHFFASKGYKAVAFDQRGYNLSSKPKFVHDYRIDILAIDVINVIKFFHRKKVILVGHDWGANVAWWTTLRFPQYIEKLVILNVPHPFVMKKLLKTNVRQMLRSWYIFLFQIPILAEFFSSFQRGLMLSFLMTSSAQKGTFSKKNLSYYRNTWNKETVYAMINWYRGMKLGSERRLKYIKVKPEFLLLWGLKDKFIGWEGIQPSLKLCDKPSYKIFPKNTHWLIHEIPDKINQNIFDFLI